MLGLYAICGPLPAAWAGGQNATQQHNGFIHSDLLNTLLFIHPLAELAVYVLSAPLSVFGLYLW